MNLFRFIVVFFISSPILSIIDFPLSVFILLACFGTLVWNRHRLKRHFFHQFVLIYFLTIAVLMVHYKSVHFIYYFFGFACVYCTLVVLKLDLIVTYIRWISGVLFFMLLGSIIGVLYHLFGFNSLATFYNPNGDESLLYLFTLSNSSAGNLIRPSGMFAEPGYLGFIAASILYLRQLFGFRFGLTSVLLFTTLITQSIAYIIFFVFFILGLFNFDSLSIRERAKRFWLLLFGAFVGLVAVFYGWFDWVIERSYGFWNEELFNVRTIGWIEISNKLSDGGFMGLIFGFDLECVFRNEGCMTFGGIPLVPLLFGGLLYSWPYYLFMIYIFFIAVKHSRFRWVSVGYLIITLSQPVFLELPYSLIYIFVLVSTYTKFGRSHNLKLSDKI